MKGTHRTRSIRGRMLALFLASVMIGAPIAFGDGLLCQARNTIGVLDLPGVPFASDDDAEIRVVNGVGFVSVGHSGMFIVDLAVPAEPRLLYHGQVLSGVRHFDIEGDLLFATTWDGTLQVIDVSDPTDPQLRASIAREDELGGVDARGDLLFIGRRTVGLEIFSITDPTAPVLLGSSTGAFPSAYLLTELEAVGDYVYGVDDQGYVDVFHVANPATPFHANRRAVGQRITGFDVAGDYAYIGHAGAALVTIDISVADPVALRLVDRLDGPRCEDVCVTDGRVYLSGPQLVVGDLADPTSPETLGSIEMIGSSGVAVDVQGSLAYVVDRNYGLAIVDVSGSLESSELLSLYGSYATTDLHVGDRFAVAFGTGLYIYDVVDPSSPTFLNRYPYGFAPSSRFALSGSTMYNADDGLLRIYELTDDGLLHLKGQTPVPGSPGCLDQNGSLAVIAGGPDGLSVVDVSNPSAPFVVGWFPGVGSIIDVRLEGEFAFAIDDAFGMVVVDLSDPAHPREVGVFAAEQARSVDVQGATACVAFGQGGLAVLDVSDPERPSEVGLFDSPLHLTSVRIYGVHALVNAGAERNVQIIDISDPAHPVRVGWMTSSPAPPAVVGDRVFYADTRLHVASLADCPTCRVDLNEDGQVDIADVQLFLALFAGEQDLADFVDDDQIDFFDLQAFLNAYAAGCF